MRFKKFRTLKFQDEKINKLKKQDKKGLGFKNLGTI